MKSSEDQSLFEKRFWEKVNFQILPEDQGCWEWVGKCNNYGYGIITRCGKELSAHRVSYEMIFGSIPFGMVVDHLCRNRKCVNPSHMEIVTNSENVHRGSRHMQTHCIRGHELSGNNLKIRKNGTRFCMACSRERNKLRRKQYA